MPGAHWNWLEHNVVFAQACQIYPSRRCKGRPQSGQHTRFVKQWQFLNESESSIGHLLNRLPSSLVTCVKDLYLNTHAQKIYDYD